MAFARALADPVQPYALRYAWLIAAMILNSHPAFGQQTDVIRGHVAGPGGAPIAGAVVIAVSVPDSTTRQARTDSTGQYSLRFDGSSGHYWVSVSHVGVEPQRRELVRGVGAGLMVADFSLRTATTRLAPVVTNAPRRRPAPSEQSEGRDPGSTGDWVDLSSGLSGDVTGDLASALATVPDITVTPGSRGNLPEISAFGITDTGYRLNGMGFGGGRIPRDGFRIRAVTNSYDPGVGGFAGAAVFASLPNGSTVPLRSLHYTEDNPVLQLATPVADQLGTRYTQRILSGSAAGPLVARGVLYNIAFQDQQRSQPLVSLLSNTDPSLVALGVTPDSVSALISNLSTRGIPVEAPIAGTSHLLRSGSIYSRLDFRPHGSSDAARRIGTLSPELSLGAGSNTNQYSLLVGGSWTGQYGAGIFPTALPCTALESTNWTGSVQAKAITYIGDVLNEAALSVGDNTGRTTPDYRIPAGRILVTSVPAAASGTASTTLPLDIGGSAAGLSSVWSSTIEAKDELSWYTANGRHKVKITADAMVDRYSVAQAAGAGSFTFASLADCEADRPATFTRTIPGAGRTSRGEHAALGVGDQWTLGAAALPARRMGNTSRPLQLSYGLRFEGDRFPERPAFNPLVDSLLGRRTDRVPSGIAVLPMVGFQKPFGTRPWEGGGGSRGVLRGGIPCNATRRGPN